MSALEFVVPSALVPAEFARALVAELELPALARIARFGRPVGGPAASGTSAMSGLAASSVLTPAETWVLRHTPKANLALVWYSALEQPTDARPHALWMLEPAHFEVGHSQLVLSDPAELALTPAESAALADAARAVLVAAGWTLSAATCERWFLGRSDPVDLEGASIDRAIGQDLASWMPSGDPVWAKRWRHTLNEIQMTWHSHPVNTAREDAGEPAVNALWLSGNGNPIEPVLAYREIDSAAPLWSRLAGVPGGTVELETFEGLIVPARREDWSSWRTALARLEQRLDLRLLQLATGALSELTLVLAGESTSVAWRISGSDLRKFWRRGALVALFSVPT